MPEDDPFYTPTPGFEKAKPGQILAKRPVPNPITLNNKDGIKVKAAWQVKFRSQNSVGEPNEGMVTILEPYNAKPDSLFVYHFFSVSMKVRSTLCITDGLVYRMLLIMGKTLDANEKSQLNITLTIVATRRSLCKQKLEKTTLSRNFKPTLPWQV